MQIHVGGIAECLRHVHALHMASASSLHQTVWKLEKNKWRGNTHLAQRHPLNIILCESGLRLDFELWIREGMAPL